MILSLRKENEIISKRTLLIGIIIISILLLLRDIAGFAIPRFAFIGIAAIICILGDITAIYCLIGFIAPLSAGVSYTFISIIALACVLIRRRHSYDKVGLISVCFILVIEFLSAFRGGFSIGEYIRFAAVFLLGFLLMIERNEGYDFQEIVRHYVIGFVVAMVDLIGQMLTKYSFSELLKLGVRMGDTQSLLGIEEEGMMLSYNENGLGTVCILATVFSLLLYRKTKNWPYLVVFILSILMGITTLSRAYLVALAIFILFVLFASGLPVKAKLGICLGLLAAWLILKNTMSNYISAFIDRFKDSDLSNGRIEITLYYFEEMIKYPDRLLIGVGLQDYRGKYDYYMSCHNATQEILVTWGVIGFVAVIVLLVSVLKNAKRVNPGVKIIQYLPFILILIYKQSGQGFVDSASMLWLMVAYCAVVAPFTVKKERDADENNSVYSNI